MMPASEEKMTRCHGLCGDIECEAIARRVVVAEARRWLGAKFHLNANIQYEATDCGRFPWAVLRHCGFEVPELPPHWPHDFMCHTDGEPYIDLIRKKLFEVATPKCADLAVFRPPKSRCFSHAAIVVDWPSVIHARGIGARPKVESATAGAWPLDHSEVRFFSVFHPQTI